MSIVSQSMKNKYTKLSINGLFRLWSWQIFRKKFEVILKQEKLKISYDFFDKNYFWILKKMFWPLVKPRKVFKNCLFFTFFRENPALRWFLWKVRQIGSPSIFCQKNTVFEDCSELIQWSEKNVFFTLVQCHQKFFLTKMCHKKLIPFKKSCKLS